MTLQVGVRELKNRLSEYLNQVKNGQTIIITEHGKPIGQIIPSGTPLEDRNWAMVKAGLAEWNGKRLEPGEPAAINRGDKLASDIVVDMREANDLH